MFNLSILSIGGWLALAWFIPVLCVVSVAQKFTKASARYEFLGSQLSYVRDSSYFILADKSLTELLGRNSIISQTMVPLIGITAFCLYFGTLIIFSAAIVVPGKLLGDFLLLGGKYTGVADPASTGALESLAVMCYAYLGWYVWTVSSIFSRMVTMELVGASYYSVLTRLVVSIFVALVYYHIQAPWQPSPVVGDAVGFGIGLFPDSALAFITTQLQKILLHNSGGVEDLPLDLIQGVSSFRRLRLYEMGLDNCQNLAAVNAVELYLLSNLTLVEVVDWIAQAQLAVQVRKRNFVLLQDHAYRHIFDFLRAISTAEGLATVATLTGLDPTLLRNIRRGVDSSPSFVRLRDLRERLVMQQGTAMRDPAAAQQATRGC